MTVSVVLAIAGVIALLFGIIGGGIKAKEVEIPHLPVRVRIVTILLGLLFLSGTFWMESRGGSIPNTGQHSPAVPFQEGSSRSESTATVTSMPTPTPMSPPTATPIPPTEVSATEALYATLVTGKTWELVLQESFDNNDKNWTLWNNESENNTISTQIDQGVLRMRLQAKVEGASHWDFAPLNTYSDFYYSVKANRVGNPPGGTTQATWGIIFRRQGNDFYALLLNDIQEYTLYLHQGEEWDPLLGPTKSNYIQVGRSNELTVVADGNEIAFYINGNAIDQIEDKTLLNGNVGFYIGTFNRDGDVILEFDDFELREKP